MDIKVEGKQVLSGEIYPSGSKNSAVALIPATLLFDKPVTLKNIPEITDVDKIISILQILGSKVSWNKEDKTLFIDNSELDFKNLGASDLGNLKGTSLLWGPMLARFKKVDFQDLPGGCTLGFRPLDTHYIAFKDLGVKVIETRNSALMDATDAAASEIWLNEMSPTATENVVMLTTSLPGLTRIIGAASEPQVQDLCEFLIAAGADITGCGTNILEIRGGKKLIPKDHKLYSDHYEITTFIALAAATGGELTVHNALPGKLTNIIQMFDNFGIKIEYKGNAAYVAPHQKIDYKMHCLSRPFSIKAQPWPGLPVDTLPLFIPLALAAKEGQAIFHNWMYEAGLFWTDELIKLGANIMMADPHRVVVTSGNKLSGAKLEAPYIIRAVVALVMAAMLSEGESIILNADAIHRGHPYFVENLKRLGAKIEEVSESR